MGQLKKKLVSFVVMVAMVLTTAGACFAAMGALNVYAYPQISVSQFLTSVKNVYEMAHNGGYQYGDSNSQVPCADGVISCDRLVARALWDLGFTDQPRGGVVVSQLPSYLTGHGFSQITDMSSLKPGDVCVTTENGGFDHTFVITAYDCDTQTCNKYDMGAQWRIESAQPFVNVNVMQNYEGLWSDKRFYAAYRLQSASTASKTSAVSLSYQRLGGAGRYDTAAMVARRAFPDGCTDAVLVSGENYPDALTGNGYAGAAGAPLLITAKNELSTQTAAVLKDFGVTHVTIIGAEAAVSAKVVADLNELGITDIDRLGGKDRYETAEMVYADGVKKDYYNSTDAIAIVNGTKAADALSMSPWTYYYAMPMLLADSNGSLDSEAINDTKIHSVKYVIGGTSAVSSAAQAALGSGVVRIQGGDRYETSVAVAKTFANTASQTEENVYLKSGSSYIPVSFSNYYNNAAFASGEDSQFADALVAGMLQGRQTLSLKGYYKLNDDGTYSQYGDTELADTIAPAPVLLVNGECCATQNFVTNELTNKGVGMQKICLIGGTGVVPSYVVNAITRNWLNMTSIA